MRIVYIHGANATSESFNYIRQKIDGESILINYDSSNGFENNLKMMKKQLGRNTQLFFVAHSLGGIYALHLANEMPSQVVGAVTISTPYGGAEVADMIKYFLPFNKLMQDISTSSWVINKVKEMKIKHPWTNVVTVRGKNPFMVEPNDGVVTIASQEYHSGDMELIEVDYNHYEVMMSDLVVDIIKNRMEKVDGQ